MPNLRTTRLLSDAINALLRRRCSYCSRELGSHAVDPVAIVSANSSTSWNTMGFGLHCPMRHLRNHEARVRRHMILTWCLQKPPNPPSPANPVEQRKRPHKG